MGQIAPYLYQFRHSLSPREIERLVDTPQLEIIQACEPVQERTWDLLNDRFFPRRPDVRLRVYGFYGDVCDLSFVRHMTNVRRFAADCLMQATGLEHICALTQLEFLSI